MPIKNRSLPTFQLTNTTEMVRVRTTGNSDFDKVTGTWVEGVPSREPINVNVQPTPVKEIMILPESERTKECITLYTTDSLRILKEGDDGWEADVVVWEDNYFKVMKIFPWKMGVLDHIKAIAVREPISAGY